MTKRLALIVAAALAVVGLSGAVVVADTPLAAPAKPAAAYHPYNEACFSTPLSTNRGSTLSWRDAAQKCALALGVAFWGSAIITSTIHDGNSNYRITIRPYWGSATSRLVGTWPIWP